VYSPTGRPTAFSIPLDEYLTDMGKQGWECCGWVPEGDGITKMILKRYAPATRRQPSGIRGNGKISAVPSHAEKTQRARRA